MTKLIFIFLISIISQVYASNITANLSFGVKQIMQSYDKSNGLWDDGDCVRSSACNAKKGFWYWANTMRLIADYQFLTGDKTYSPILSQTLAKNKDDIIGADYFDDEGWWALALISSYEATNNLIYLKAAEDVVNDIGKRGAQAVCGNGGIYWDKKKTQVGTIANELFISANAKLYMITENEKYKKMANDTWDWFNSSGLISGDNSIADHYKITSDGKCGDKVSWNFTYTNGMLFSTLADLSKINKNPKLMEQAKRIAESSMYDFTMAGVLTEPCTSVQTCADDAFMFKGIFVHELTYLALSANDKIFSTSVAQYLSDNYNKLVLNQGDLNLYAFSWGLPNESNQDSSLYNPSDVITELSALYLMDANLMLTKGKPTRHNPYHHVHSPKRQVNRPVHKSINKHPEYSE